jgi:oligogalacturonide lyase
MRIHRNTHRLAARPKSDVGHLCVFSLRASITVAFLLAATVASSGQEASAAPSAKTQVPPYNWVDADNGTHVIRLTNEPGSRALGSQRNAFTPDGKDMIYLSNFGLQVINLATRRVKILVPGHIQSLAVGTKTRRVFFSRGSNIYLYVVDIDTGAITKLGNLPVLGEITSVNSDETLLVGKNVVPGGLEYQQYLLQATQKLIKERDVDPNVQITDDAIKERAMKMRVAAKNPEDLFTFNLQTGQVNTILHTTDWLDYAQFSPTDPTLILYTHQGMYYETNRIWTIRSDGSQNQLIHERQRTDESATKEFWSKDGKTIWYEWQKPRDKEFAMVGYDVASGNRRLFRMEKDELSISYNGDSGDAFFVGSGRHSGGTHRASSMQDGEGRNNKQSIEILYPTLIDVNTKADPEYSSLFNFDNEIAHTYQDAKYVGWFRRVTIANMLKNDYTKLEPNIRVSPDNSMVIFTSNMLGPTYIFAVKLK